MSNKQELLEKYIDAFFVVAMDELAQEEGRKALSLNDQLKNDPDAVVPNQIQFRCHEIIQNKTNHRNHLKKRWNLWDGIRIASIIVLLLAATLSLTLATQPEPKDKEVTTVLKEYDTHTVISFKPSVLDFVPQYLIINPVWLPEGFIMEESGWTTNRSWQSYRNDIDEAIIQIEKIYETSADQFEKNSVGESTEIQGYPAKILSVNHTVKITWLDTDTEVIHVVYTELIPIADALKVAENIQ